MALLVRENKQKSERSQVRPPTWAPLKKGSAQDSNPQPRDQLAGRSVCCATTTAHVI